MSFAPVYPVWYWFFFAVGGSIAALSFIGVMWYQVKAMARVQGVLRSVARWRVFGYTFLFMAAWAA